MIEGLKEKTLLGTPLTLTSYQELISTLYRRVGKTASVLAIDFTNTQIVTTRRRDPWFRDITQCFDAFIPDGMPLIWCLNLMGAGLKDRVYGPTFMRECLKSSPPAARHYFLGGSGDCLQKLTANIRSLNPQIHIVGSHHGYFQSSDEKVVLLEIQSAKPDFVWVGLGTPKQQQWICSNKEAVGSGCVLAVGFAFDVNAGTKKDAPIWMQKVGLTWLFRISQEPGRLLCRYLINNSRFLWYLLKDFLCSPSKGRVSK